VLHKDVYLTMPVKNNRTKDKPRLSSEAIEAQLRECGLRVTQARLHILGLLMANDGALNHQQIEDYLSQNGLITDRVTIYRTLHSLTDTGILHKITGLDRTFSYAYQNHDVHDHKHASTHPHFVCEHCSQTICLPDVTVAISNMQTPDGFEFHHTELKLVGLCAECS